MSGYNHQYDSKGEWVYTRAMELMKERGIRSGLAFTLARREWNELEPEIELHELD